MENMPKRHSNTNKVAHNKVVALVYSGLCTFEFGIVSEVFGLHRPEIEGAWYTFQPVALENGPLLAAGGLEFSATGTEKDLENANTIIVPGWRGKDEAVPSSMCRALHAAHQKGTRIVSICSGVYVLAAAGLLAGRRVTTHWKYLQDFGGKFPDVIIEPDNLYVDDEDIMTSAGSSAGIDLCLHIVRKDYGARIANSVARRLVMHAHRQGGQTQYIEQPVPDENEAHRLSSTLDHIRSNIDKVHSVSSLANLSGMSTRSFQRKFITLTGMPVGRWVRQERLIRARTLLETSQGSINDVAEAVGMPNVEGLRYHFRNHFGVSPGQYRKRFSL